MADTLSQHDLALRWGRSVAAIGLASAVGVGPRYVKVNGAVRYLLDDVLRYEQRFQPREMAGPVLQSPQTALN